MQINKESGKSLTECEGAGYTIATICVTKA